MRRLSPTNAKHLSEKFAFQSLTYKGFEIDDFSLTSQEVCAPAQTSGVKNLASARFFTLPQHAGARKCAGNRQQMQSICPKNSRRRFFVGITGCLCSATSIRSEKNAIERFFHSFDHVSLHSRFPERECPAAERDQYSMFSCASHSHHPYRSCRVLYRDFFRP